MSSNTTPSTNSSIHGVGLGLPTTPQSTAITKLNSVVVDNTTPNNDSSLSNYGSTNNTQDTKLDEGDNTTNYLENLKNETLDQWKKKLNCNSNSELNQKIASTMYDIHAKGGYLKHFGASADQIEKLKKRYKCSEEELNLRLHHNRVTLWYLILFPIASYIPEVSYAAFQIMTGEDGIKESAQLIDSNLTVSDRTAFLINIIIASDDFIYNLHTFEIVEPAIAQTLDYATFTLKHPSTTAALCRTFCDDQCYPDNINDLNRRDFVANYFSATAKYILKNAHHFTGGILNVVDLFPFAKEKFGYEFPLPVQGIIVALGAVLGKKGYSLMLDEDFDKGIQFMGDKTKPSLFSEVRNGNYAVPFEVLFQGRSMEIVRTMSFMGGCDAIRASSWGFWYPHPFIIGPLVYIHTTLSRYETTYNFYYDDMLAVRASIRADFEQKGIPIPGSQNQRIDFNDFCNVLARLSNESDIEKIKTINVNKYAEKLRKDFEEKYKNVNGRCGAFYRDFVSYLPAMIQGAYGAYELGWKVLTPLITIDSKIKWLRETLSIVAMILGPALGTVMAALPTYFADKTRSSYAALRKSLGSGSENKPASAPRESNKAIVVTAIIVAAISMFGRMMSNLGSAREDVDTSELNTVLFNMAFKTTLNTFFLMLPKVVKALEARWGWCCQSSCSPSRTSSSMYQYQPVPPTPHAATATAALLPPTPAATSTPSPV